MNARTNMTQSTFFDYTLVKDEPIEHSYFLHYWESIYYFSINLPVHKFHKRYLLTYMLNGHININILSIFSYHFRNLPSSSRYALHLSLQTIQSWPSALDSFNTICLYYLLDYNKQKNWQTKEWLNYCSSFSLELEDREKC